MIAFSLPAPTREDQRRGIFFALLSVLVFGAVNAMVKWLVAIYPATEIILFRCIFSLLPTAFLVFTNGGPAGLRTRYFGIHAVLALVHFSAMLLMFTASGLMPLADVTALSFSSPLFVTVLSIPLLGEPLGRHRSGAVVVGFIGVLIMVGPGAGILKHGAIIAIAAAFFSALLAIGIRRMSRTEASTTLLFYQVALTACLSLALIPIGWITPGWFDLMLLAAIGILSSIGQYWWMKAFRSASAVVAAPFAYTGLIWAALFGFLVWGDVPTLTLIAGAGLIAASALYIVYRETIHRLPGHSQIRHD